MILESQINIIDLEFPDGNSPPKEVVNRWLKIVKEQFGSKRNQVSKSNFEDSKNENDNSIASGTKKENGRIGIHCLAGLGRYEISLNNIYRAPVLVALALIHYGSSPENAIELIRKQRPGAINHAQANFILKFKKAGSSCNIF